MLHNPIGEDFIQVLFILSIKSCEIVYNIIQERIGYG